MNLKDKVAVITGAGGGLGLVYCRSFLEEGAIVVMTDISQQMLDQGKKKLSEYVASIRTKILDVSNAYQVESVMEEVFKEYGHIDILVNNAGGGLHTPRELEKLKEEHWDKVVDINLKGTFLCCQSAIKYMAKNKYGRIVNVSSISGRTASIVTNVAYAAAKGGIISMTRRLAYEVGPLGINVNTIAPGLVMSGQRMLNVWNELNEKQKEDLMSSIPLNRMSSAEEQANVVLFLADEASSYITGAVIDVNGGRFMAG